MENNRFYVSKANIGYVIRDRERTLPLPFSYLGRKYTEDVCEKINKRGIEYIYELYYIHKVAGKGYGKKYTEWREENDGMFK